MSNDKQLTKAEVLKRVEVARDQLEKIPSPKVKSHLSGFLTFVREQGVVGLAIGLVLGAQVKVLVDQIVLSFINPLVGLLLPGEGSLNEKAFALTLNDKTQNFLWGAFISQFISFITVAAIVYFVFKSLHLEKLEKKKED